MLKGGSPKIILFATIVLAFCVLASRVFSDYGLLNASSTVSSLDGKKHDDTRHTPLTPIRLENLYGLFGQAKKQNAQPAKTLSETRLNLTLKGTFTHRENSQQSALISSESGSTRRYHIGEEVASGVEIISIAPGIVTLRRNGQDEVLKLPLLSDTLTRKPAPSGTANQAALNRLVLPSNSTSVSQNSSVAVERNRKLKERLEKLRNQSNKE